MGSPELILRDSSLELLGSRLQAVRVLFKCVSSMGWALGRKAGRAEHHLLSQVHGKGIAKTYIPLPSVGTFGFYH